MSTLYTVTDLSDNISSNRPPSIDGFIPDIFCGNISPPLTVIGEVKTSKDLQTSRSLKQIAAFYDHLTHTKGGHLAIGVTWSDESFAFNLLKQLSKRESNKYVKTSVVSEMRVLQCC